MTTPRATGPKRSSREAGSALTEAAIMFPVMILILWWSSAMTDVMILKLKGLEAARFALWETTVFRTQVAIAADVQARFRDLRSPASINNVGTGLLMYPQSNSIAWSTAVNTKAGKVALGGRAKLPPADGWLMRFVNQVVGFLSRSVDTAVERQKFNVYGYAEARVALTRASHTGSMIMNGGDLVGAFGQNQLDHPPNMRNFSFLTPLPSERPFRLVFDTWKAWPKPVIFTTNGAPSNTNALPTATYATVDQQVSAQVQNMAFFGLTRLSWFNKVRQFLAKLTTSGLSNAVFGGELPDMFSSNPLGGKAGDYTPRGPISILPVEQPTESWAAKSPIGKTHRLGDLGGTGNAATTTDEDHQLSQGVDRSRYTVPYRINSVYWRREGGTNRNASSYGAQIARPRAQIATNNEYVRTYACRGHFFSGGIAGEIYDPTKRYRAACNR